MITLFGSTFKETRDALDNPLHFGKEQKEDRTKAIGRIIISVLLLFVGTYLFTSNEKQEGSLIIGALLGYWVK